MAGFDPFASEEKTPKPEVEMQSSDNWVSFSFNSAPGYDRIGATVHGDPQFVAKVLAVEAITGEPFKGKLSSLMTAAVEVDKHFKSTYGQSGKA